MSRHYEARVNSHRWPRCIDVVLVHENVQGAPGGRPVPTRTSLSGLTVGEGEQLIAWLQRAVRIARDFEDEMAR